MMGGAMRPVLTGAVIAASLVASTLVRELFGYSFSTWRFHLRGETIKSARDVGWMKALTAGRMMRREANATPAAMTIAEFRRRFPLGSRAVDIGDRNLRACFSHAFGIGEADARSGAGDEGRAAGDVELVEGFGV